MLDEIYSTRILALAAGISRIGTLEAPDARVTRRARICGSAVTVDLVMQDDVVSAFAHEVRACALGQAAASVMASAVVGARAGELRAVRETMRRMLEESGPPPEGRFAALRWLEGVRAYPARHASTMLTFDAVVEAIGLIEASRAEREPAPANGDA